MESVLGCEVCSLTNGISFSVLPSARPLLTSASSNVQDDLIADDLFELLFNFLRTDDEAEASCQDRHETIDHLGAALSFLESSSCYQQTAVDDFLLFTELAAQTKDTSSGLRLYWKLPSPVIRTIGLIPKSYRSRINWPRFKA